jgi:hypothetical protein
MAMLAIAYNYFKRDQAEQQEIASKSFANVVAHVGSNNTVSAPIDKAAWITAHPNNSTPIVKPQDIIQYGEAKQQATDKIVEKYTAQRDRSSSSYLIPVGIAATAIIIVMKSI